MAACKVGKLLGTTNLLGRLDRSLLRGWVDTGEDPHGRRVPATTMASALRREGQRLDRPQLDVSPTVLKDHRGRRCVCFREATQ